MLIEIPGHINRVKVAKFPSKAQLWELAAAETLPVSIFPLILLVLLLPRRRLSVSVELAQRRRIKMHHMESHISLAGLVIIVTFNYPCLTLPFRQIDTEAQLSSQWMAVVEFRECGATHGQLGLRGE